MNQFELHLAVELIARGVLRVQKGGKRLVPVKGKGTGARRS
jgi:hypothetical protein